MRIIGGLLLAFGLAGCASQMDSSEMPREPGHAVVENDSQKPLQCVPYAREHSGIKSMATPIAGGTRRRANIRAAACPRPAR